MYAGVSLLPQLRHTKPKIATTQQEEKDEPSVENIADVGKLDV